MEDTAQLKILITHGDHAVTSITSEKVHADDALFIGRVVWLVHWGMRWQRKQLAKDAKWRKKD